MIVQRREEFKGRKTERFSCAGETKETTVTAAENEK